jgi:hypothetical protein
VIHDRDSKFSKEFTKKLSNRGVRTNPLPIASPNLNGRCERFIGTIKHECLLKFVIFGKRHLDYLVIEFVDYYIHHRSHMERDHLPPIREIPEEVEKLSFAQVVVKSYVGGLVKSFERKATEFVSNHFLVSFNLLTDRPSLRGKCDRSFAVSNCFTSVAQFGERFSRRNPKSINELTSKTSIEQEALLKRL